MWGRYIEVEGSVLESLQIFTGVDQSGGRIFPGMSDDSKNN